jgi:hypothetical protein
MRKNNLEIAKKYSHIMCVDLEIFLPKMVQNVKTYTRVKTVPLWLKLPA